MAELYSIAYINIFIHSSVDGHLVVICSNMDGPNILSEVSQAEKDKHHMISPMCSILKMTHMNLFIKQTHSVYSYLRGKGGGAN